MPDISSTSLRIAIDLRTVADQRQFELEAGEDGAQIMRDAGQHRGALLDRALDAGLHLQESLRRAPHLARAAGPEVRRLAALAKTFGSIRQPQDRPDLVAQEQHRDDQEDRRRAQHPEDEDLGIGSVGGAALGIDTHHRVIELDADFHQVGAADGIDPERSADLAAKLHRERSGRAARRTASDRAAACRRREGNRPPDCSRCAMRRSCARSLSCG